MIRLLLLVTSLTMSLAQLAIAQGSQIRWESQAHPFGRIKEEGGPVKARFVFYNMGPAPLHVSYAQASCGCTTPSWTQQPVAVGDSGYVEAEFHPEGRPGAFTKKVSVTTDAATPVHELIISGEVIAKAPSIAEQYPDTIGLGLRLKSRYMNVGTVSPVAGKTKAKFEVYNAGSHPVRLGAKAGKWATIRMQPATLPPSTKGMLEIVYDGQLRNDFGPVTDNVVAQVRAGKSKRSGLFYLTANLESSPQNLSQAELELASKISADATHLNAGQTESGKMLTRQVRLTNKGQEVLTIYKVKTTCICAKTELTRKRLLPGETALLAIHLDGEGKVGVVQQAVSVYSSDPLQPRLDITLSASFFAKAGQNAAATQ